MHMIAHNIAMKYASNMYYPGMFQPAKELLKVTHSLISSRTLLLFYSIKKCNCTLCFYILYLQYPHIAL